MAAPLARHKKIDRTGPLDAVHRVSTRRICQSGRTLDPSLRQPRFFSSRLCPDTAVLLPQVLMVWGGCRIKPLGESCSLPTGTMWFVGKHGSDIDCKSAVSEKTASTLRLNKPRILQRAFGHISNRRSSQWMCFNPRAQASICLYIYSLIYSDISMSLYLIIFIHVRICVCMYVCMYVLYILCMFILLQFPHSYQRNFERETEQKRWEERRGERREERESIGTVVFMGFHCTRFYGRLQLTACTSHRSGCINVARCCCCLRGSIRLCNSLLALHWSGCVNVARVAAA